MFGFSFLKIANAKHLEKSFHALTEYDLMIMPIALVMKILSNFVIAMVVSLWLEPTKNNANQLAHVE